MKHTFWYLGILVLGISACSKPKPEAEKFQINTSSHEVLEQGEVIRFQSIPKTFDTYAISTNSFDGKFEAPAQVAASVLKHKNENSETIILFDDPEITDMYTSLLQSSAHYQRDRDFNERVKDMYEHSAATGKELNEAQTGMIDAATELAEKEARLQMYGFEPNELRKAKQGIVWLISNVNESALGVIKPGKPCTVEFIAYPGETFNATVAAIGEVLDNSTQTIKVRVTLSNPQDKFKPGMFAKISFGLSEANILGVPQSALITAQGKTYVFKKRGNDFVRQEVQVRNQIGNSIIIKEGLERGDTIVTKGTMLLKGLSFGY